MNDDTFALAEQLVSSAYIRQAQQARNTRASLFRSLLQQRRLPDVGWDDGTLRLLLDELALMDSNAFVGNAGVGEREARVICPMVSARHFGLGHGVGRSGDIAEEQPKAAGSSLIYKLTNALAGDALRRAGAADVRECLVLPVATGMSVTLTMLALRKLRGPGALYVVWPRIDQKSCLKAVAAAGCVPLVVENVLEGDELRTDVDGVRTRIAEVGAERVLCVLSTTSCFAPRGVDKLLDLARLCAVQGVPHVANNAYGVQCKQCMKAIASASRHGRLDAFVQSTDKNFLVPVGGAIVASCGSTPHGKALLSQLSATYPGRASIAPILDLFMTLLHLGADGWIRLLAQREALLPSFRERLAAVAHAHGERLLATPHNTISHAVTLTSGGGGKAPTAMGAQLWVRLISGARIVAPSSEAKEVSGIAFTNYGASYDAYPCAYFTAACALGATEAEADLFFKRLDKTLKEWKKMKPHPPQAALPPPGQPAAAPPEQPQPPTKSTQSTQSAGAGGVGATPAGEVGAGSVKEGARASEAPRDVSEVGSEPRRGQAAQRALAAAAPDGGASQHAAPDGGASQHAALDGGASQHAALDGGASRAFVVRSERVVYKRFLQVESREVAYPDGRTASFDIVGHPKNRYVFVVVFVFHTASQSVTLLREFAQAAPPHSTHVLSLPCGGYEPSKHASMEAAARAELSEEAHLSGGAWHCLLPHQDPGILEAKWCRNRFTPFLCIDPEADSRPGARDAEEEIEVLREWPLTRLREAMAAGELLLPSLQTSVSALAWLERAGMLQPVPSAGA